MSHTPGPWITSDYNRGSVESADRERHIATVSGVPMNARLDKDDERKYAEPLANARLIAAAPDLLEALRDVLDALGALGKPYELEGYGISADRAQNIVSILAQAEGK